jgi:HD superfamily phosphohydrolase
LSELRERVNLYVEAQLQNYTPPYIKSPKVIHDSILGTNIFYPHEIAILDSPLLQRLRRISQVDVVPLIFPSGNHNRFEHSLGVTVISDKMVQALNTKKLMSETDFDFDNLRLHVRMAGILHDCGHGAFSHMSEEIYKHYPDLKKEREEKRELYGDAKAHEILSYLIVTSSSFSNFVKEHILDVYDKAVDLDLNLIGEMIIGHVSRNDKAFWVEIINGAFDADKLDYIQRDSHFTGIQMILDLDRLFHTVDLITINNKRRLTIDFSGISTLEEIVFDKMMLISTVYNHHKVRAAECLFNSIFKELKKQGTPIYGIDFSSAADFLRITDDDIYSLAKQDLGKASELARNLLNRNLPKRALVISGRTIEDQGRENLVKLMALTPEQNLLLRESIIEEVQKSNKSNKAITVDDLWIDLPHIPKFKEGALWPIKTFSSGSDYILLRNVFPVDDWTRAFSENKWQGHIFTWPDYVKDVNVAATKVIGDAFSIKLNDFSRSLCKIS